jgi:REP element-mobilizing transposase RayT
MGETARTQTRLDFRTHGGRRRRAGRKTKGQRAGVSHRARPELNGREPILITMKMKQGIWGLRTRNAFQQILPALAAAAAQRRIRLVHYSIQRDHIHLIVEAVDKLSLSRGVQGLAVRIAKRLNQMMARTGKVFADRFHERVLRSPKQVRNALRYVLLNARKHGVAPPQRDWLDPYSSAAAFDGWAVDIRTLWPHQFVPPTVAPRSWLLSRGWRRAGPTLDPGERPGAPD